MQGRADLQLPRLEEVVFEHGADVAGFETFLEPAHALLGGAVSEGVGHDVSLRLFLKPVVSDGVGGSHRLLNIALFEKVFHALGMMGPDAGEVVGLEFEADGEFVVFGFAYAALYLVHLVGDAEEVLHVMTDFVGDDVGLGKVTRGAQLISEIAIEAEIDVDFLIGRAIERAGLGTGEATTGLDFAREEHKARLPVALAVAPEELIPDVLGISEDGFDELGEFVIRSSGARSLLLNLALGRIPHLLEKRLRVSTEKDDEQDDDKGAEAASDGEWFAAHASPVFDIGALTSAFPAHDF
jgi:hypothetical protein